MTRFYRKCGSWGIWAPNPRFSSSGRSWAAPYDGPMFLYHSRVSGRVSWCVFVGFPPGERVSQPKFNARTSRKVFKNIQFHEKTMIFVDFYRFSLNFDDFRRFSRNFEDFIGFPRCSCIQFRLRNSFPWRESNENTSWNSPGHPGMMQEPCAVIRSRPGPSRARKSWIRSPFPQETHFR